MANKVLKYGMMIATALMLIEVVFAGAASAAVDPSNIQTAQNLSDYLNEIEGDSAILSGNKVTLQKNVALPAQLIFENSSVASTTDSEIILNLNAHTINCTGNVHGFACVQNGRTFTLMDDSGTGKITGFGNLEGGAVMINGGTFNMVSGNIVNCTAVQGDVDSAKGGAVCLRGGEFNMTGGTIAYCQAVSGSNDAEGGAVYLLSEDKAGSSTGNSTFKMSNSAKIIGCKVITNSETRDGGAVFLYDNGFGYSSTFIMSDNACISDCEAENGGAVMIFGEKSKFIMSDNAKISNCTAVLFGGGVLIRDGVFEMSGGSVEECKATKAGAGVDVYSNDENGNPAFIVNGTACVSPENEVALYRWQDIVLKEEKIFNIGVGEEFTGSIGKISLYNDTLCNEVNEVTDEDPSAWVGKVIAKNGGAALASISLSTSDLYKGYQLSKLNDDIMLNVSTANVTASGGVATFGNDNYTVVVPTVQNTVSKLLLNDVSHVINEKVEFTAYNTTIGDIPSITGYSKQKISVFEIAATANGMSWFNLTITFENADIASANKNNVWFFHYNTTNKKWDDTKLPGSIVADDGTTNITYQVETVSFSPFCSGIYTPNPQPSPSYSGSSRISGYTVILPETAVPTVTPTVTPTSVSTPATPSTPVTNTITKPTQSSPIPLAGLIAGLATVAVLLSNRRK